MKKLTLYAAVISVTLFAISCGGKKHEEAANNNEWPEMDEFHDVMADSFHPFMDSANLEPAKANAAEMARIADKWADAPLPESMDNDEAKSNLSKLKTDANAFVQIVQGGDTVKMGESLTDLHTLFHKLQEFWYESHKKDKDHEHKH